MDLNSWHMRARERGVNRRGEADADMVETAKAILARGEPVFPEGTRDQICDALGQTAEPVASVPLLAARLKHAGVDAPVLRGLAGIIKGRVEITSRTASLTAPRAVKSIQTARAA